MRADERHSSVRGRVLRRECVPVRLRLPERGGLPGEHFGGARQLRRLRGQLCSRQKLPRRPVFDQLDLFSNARRRSTAGTPLSGRAVSIHSPLAKGCSMPNAIQVTLKLRALIALIVVAGLSLGCSAPAGEAEASRAREEALLN